MKWQKDVAKAVKAKRPTWGYASSPVIINDALLVNVGTYGTCLDKNTGNIIWQTGGAVSGYSSMVPYVRARWPARGGAVRGGGSCGA